MLITGSRFAPPPRGPSFRRLQVLSDGYADDALRFLARFQDCRGIHNALVRFKNKNFLHYYNIEKGKH